MITIFNISSADKLFYLFIDCFAVLIGAEIEREIMNWAIASVLEINFITSDSDDWLVEYIEFIDADEWKCSNAT